MEKQMQNEKKKLYYGFVLIVGLFFLQFPGSLIMGAASVFYTPVSEELGIPLSAYGMHMTILQISLVILMPVYARIVKRYDLRKVMSVCLVIEALVFSIRAMASNIWIIYLSAVLGSVVFTVFNLLSIPMLMNAWFPFHTGIAIGVVASAQGIAGMLFSSLGGIIIQNHGWRTCFWIWAAICLMFLPITLFVICTKPADKGLKPYGFNSQRGESDAEFVPSGVDAKEAFHSLPFMLCMIAMTVSCFASSYNFYLNSYFRTIGMSTALAGIVASFSQGGIILAKLVIGRLCDWNIRAATFYYLGATIICALLMLFGGTGMVPIIIASLLFANIWSATNLHGPAITKHLFGLKDFTQIWAVFTMGIQFFGAIGSTVWGIIVENAGYQISLILVVIFSVISLVLFNLALSFNKNSGR